MPLTSLSHLTSAHLSNRLQVNADTTNLRGQDVLSVILVGVPLFDPLGVLVSQTGPRRVRVRAPVGTGDAERADGGRSIHCLPDVRSASNGEGRGRALPDRDRQTADPKQASPAGEAEHHAAVTARRAHDCAAQVTRGPRPAGRICGHGK